MPKQKKKKTIDMQSLLFLTLLVVLLGIGVYVIVDSIRGEPANIVKFDYAKQPSIGSSTAPVKLMEFGDFKCPTCKRFHSDVYKQLKKEYIDTGKVQMFFTNYQFLGPDSLTAGMVGESIFKQNPQAFWKYYDVIYQNQQEESKVWATPAFLIDLVKKHIPEVDAEKVASDLQSKKYEKEVLADNSDAENKYKLTGVPDVYINGKSIENPLNYQMIKEAIESELQNK